ncbi:SPFH domain-containing protein [Nocardioides panzhihuensis]|uniref:Regulator of protease activity HflC (Stomatin/prohibitin superfamily) n=1 Tax=Nocardioides panzhihuensis TaxID=860243 RepID=A0A7Z0DRL9_9ACTN|nr:SPFH domain-containing protein [Nocardioides panzhihuensis]NYI80500.1 regulator of protease activity HflC (stomatin/prohibitin superfamily) [Nocardioides panzhihuensis]
MGQMATVSVIAVVAVVLVVASLLRRARRGECLVVTRHRRIVRIASGSTTLAVPGFHEVLEWPTGQIEIAVVVRAQTMDGQDVRALATFSVDVDPPRIGAAYIDPRAVLHTALERRIAEAVRARPAATLADERDGLRPAVDGIRIDGLAGGSVMDVVIDEVDLLLHPGRPDEDG